MAESQWYLEVNGKKVGPFTLDQVQGLHTDGEIKGYHQVTSDELDGQWISVQDLVDSLADLESNPPPPPISDSGAIEIPTLEEPSELIDMSELSGEPSGEPAPPPPPSDESSYEEAYEPATTQIVLEESIAKPVLEAAPLQVSLPTPESEPAYEHAEQPASQSMDQEDSTRETVLPAQEFNAGFQPPPRPGDLKTPSSATAALAEAPGDVDAQPGQDPVIQTLAEPPVNDPALSMLSSLQLFRERQESHREPDRSLIIHSENLSSDAFKKSIPARMWLTAIFAGIILGCLSWAAIRALKAHPPAPAGTMTQISSSTHTPPPPVAAAAPSAPPAAPNSTFRSVEAPKFPGTHRMTPPRPLTAPQSEPAPVRQPVQPQEQQLPQGGEPIEVPPQPQYAPQYQQQYPTTGDQLPNQQPLQPQQQGYPQQQPQPTQQGAYPENYQNPQGMEQQGQPQYAQPPQPQYVPQQAPPANGYEVPAQNAVDPNQGAPSQEQQQQPPPQNIQQ